MKMSDAQKKLGTVGEIDKSEKNRQVGKMKFTPPVLHKYGEVVKICQEGPNVVADDATTFLGFS
jgi:hypothetical protein